MLAERSTSCCDVELAMEIKDADEAVLVGGGTACNSATVALSAEFSSLIEASWSAIASKLADSMRVAADSFCARC